METFIFFVVILVTSTVHILEGDAATCPNRPVVTFPSIWVEDKNCLTGHTYDVTSPKRYHCHCWGNCGYICNPSDNSETYNCGSPPVAFPSTWVADENCSHGKTYDMTSPDRYHCHCWGHCGYICDPPVAVTTTTTEATTITPGITEASTTPEITLLVSSTTTDTMEVEITATTGIPTTSSGTTVASATSTGTP